MKPQACHIIPGALVLALALVSKSLSQAGHERPNYLNAQLPIEERVNDLLSRMTLEEKVAQLQCTSRRAEWEKNITEKGIGGVGPVLRPLSAAEAARKANEIQKHAIEKTRLGIPVIIHDEALHGLVANEATSFPQAIGLASTWDTDLMQRVAATIGRETRSRGIRQVLSPVINIARDVRWGRVEETYGEDPYLTARMGVAYCRGVEREGVIATPKHFAANVGDGGRDSHPVHFSERLIREIYFPAFKACFQEGYAGSVMAAYNAIDGVPCSASKWLLTDMLRKEWGFKGFVVSDYGSVWGIKNKHLTAATEEEAAVQAVEAGLDMELPEIQFYGAPLLTAAKEGRVSISAIDDAVRNILRAKFRLGLFENPYIDSETTAKLNDSQANRELARQAAREAIVLLKNEHNVLPLSKTIKSIAVIGPNANVAQLGGYSGWGMKTVSILEGIRSKVSSTTQVRYAKGCEIGFASLPPIPEEYLRPPGAKAGEYGLRGEYFNNMSMSGNPALTRIDKRVAFEWAMGSPDSAITPDHFSIRWTGKLRPPVSGTYRLGASTDDGVRLFLDGKLLIDSWFDRGATLDVVTVKLEASREYEFRMDYYENEGWTYASLGWQLVSGPDTMLQRAVDAAKKSELAVIVASIIEGEGYDRANLDLPGPQEALIKAVSETGTPIVVLLMTGSAVTMKSWVDSVPAIIEAWYPGEEGGNAVAEVLFGDYNPGGRLPITFPQHVGQVPLYYNSKPSGRGYDYTDMSGKPLFPFGSGLSYTQFEYSNLEVSPERMTPDGKVRVTLSVQNVGDREGSEVVQLYLHDVVASVTRPLKELKGFKKITLAPKETKQVIFELSWEELSFLDRAMKYVFEPGIYEVLVGSSSEDIRLRSSFEFGER